jgi:hypothetical protein
MLADLLETLSTATFWVAVLRIATPLILGTTGWSSMPAMTSGRGWRRRRWSARCSASCTAG